MQLWGSKFSRFRLKSSHIGNNRGQSIILISMMIMSFLLFFEFVINTGVLITAKISLQTAADAAAYAGAAVQARQLNAISYLNYDMRRQYKKYIYRSVFVGNMARGKFQNQPNPPIPPQGRYGFYIKDFSDSNVDNSSAKLIPMFIPVICLPITTNGKPDDNCIKANLPNTANQLKDIFPTGGLDSLTQTLTEQLEAMGKVQDNLCKARGLLNKNVTLAWLFRGDMTVGAISNFFNPNLQDPSEPTLNSGDLTKAITAVKGLTEGLGLYPRNIINRMRIDTLEQFLNQPPLADIDQEKATDLEHDGMHAEANERTIQAFQSALSNLNTNTFPAGVTMSEIMGSQPQLKTKPIDVDFNAFYQHTEKDTGGVSPNPKLTCIMKVETIPLKGAPVGVIKESGFTRYAVKLKAKVRLFMPSSMTIDLEAVSGATPFGSRIGPEKLTSDDFSTAIPPGSIGGQAIFDCSLSTVKDCLVPNLNLLKSPNTTYLSEKYLFALSQLAAPNNNMDMTGLKLGMDLAMAPSQEEIGQYNILPAPPRTGEEELMKYEFIPYWDPNPKNKSKPIYRFYAPVFANTGGDVEQYIKKFLTKMFNETQVQSSNGFNSAVLQQMIIEQLKPYIMQNLSNPSPTTTENNESLTFAAIEFPIQPKVVDNKGPYWLSESSKVLSSWAPDYVRTGPNQFNGSSTFKPRFGYSVKFVSMQNLLQMGMPDEDGDLSKVNH